MRALLVSLLCALPLAPAATPLETSAHSASDKKVYQEDVAFALDALEKECGHFFKLKDIDWKKVRSQFTKDVKKVKTDQEQWILLRRLLARIKDGHCYVEPLSEIAVPEEWQVEHKGPGFFLCQVGKKYYIKMAWSSAEDLGIGPGMEVLTIDEKPAKKWIEERIEEASDMRSFSTDQHALHWVLNRGFQKPEGERLKIEFKGEKNKKKKRTITLTRASSVPDGPAVYLEGYTSVGDSVRWAKSPRGYAYLHFRRTKPEVVDEIDEALAALEELDGLKNHAGMILDFRGNSGGGCDHEAFESRFLPKGKKMPRLARDPLEGAGPNTYGGPIVVIVDGTTVSAGETTSGMFKEDGRAYMIGESPTAGMSSQKKHIELPSGMFQLYVSIGSNRSSFNGGRGIEGIGVIPHEIVEFDPEELKIGVDSIIRQAEDLLDDFPQKKVKYDPEDYGWGT